MAFDPDAYLAGTGGFNPDAYLAGQTQADQPKEPSLAEKAVSLISPIAKPQEGGFLSRLVQGTKELFAPNKEGIKRLVSPVAGQFGPSRVLEQAGQKVGGAVSSIADTAANNIAESKFGQSNPNLAASVGIPISVAGQVLGPSLTPSGAQSSMGLDAGGGVAGGMEGQMWSKLYHADMGPIGSALDAIVGSEKGSSKIALEHPDITKPGYLTMGRVKDFIGRLSDSLGEYETNIKNSWKQTLATIDNKIGQGGLVDRNSLDSAVSLAEKRLGVNRTPSINPIFKNAVSGGDALLPNKVVTPGTPDTVIPGVLQEIVKGKPESISYKTPSVIPGKANVSPEFSSDFRNPAIKIIQDVKGRLDSMTTKSDALLGQSIPKPTLNLGELVDLRQTADNGISWGKQTGGLDGKAQSVLKGLRDSIDEKIRNTPGYSDFKAEDAKYTELNRTVQEARQAFGLPRGKSVEDLTPQELVTMENKIRRTLKKNESEHTVVKALDEKLAKGQSFLTEAQKIAAAGGSSPARFNQFTPLLRPGFGYAKLAGGIGLGASGMAAALGHPGAALAGLAGEAAGAVLTSPRAMFGAILPTLRAASKIPTPAAPIGNYLSPIKKSRMSDALKKNK